MATKTKSKPKGKAGPEATPDPDRAVTLPEFRITGPDGRKVATIKLADISVGEKADRVRDERFEASVRELAASMATDGLLQPIGVRAAKKPSEFAWVLVFGERRLRAAQALGWTDIRAMVVEGDDDVSRLRLVENVQRADIDEETKALVIGQRVAVRMERELAGVKPEGLSAQQRDTHFQAACRAVAQELGWPVRRVRDYAFMADLPEPVRKLGAQGRLSLAHLKVLAQVVDPDQCVDLAEEHAAGEDPAALPMADLDTLKGAVHHELASLAKVPWDKSTPIRDLPACDTCPHNSLNRRGLFEAGQEVFVTGERNCMDMTKADGGVCLRIACYKAKAAAVKDQIRKNVGRVLTQVEKAPAKERPAALKAALKDFAGPLAAAFVSPTVFGREVRERVEARVGTSGKPKSSGSKGPARQSESPADEAKKAAREAWRRDTCIRNEKVFKAMVAAAKKLSPGVQARLDMAVGGYMPHDVKPETIRRLAGEAVTADWSEKSLGRLFTDAGGKLLLSEWSWSQPRENGGQLVDAMAEALGLKDLPPVPDFKKTLDEHLANMGLPTDGAKPAKGKKPKGGKPAKPAPEENEDVDADDAGDE